MKIKVGNKIKEISLVNKENNKVEILVDDKTYNLDIVMAENGLCSIITEDGHSYNAELKPSENNQDYTVSVAFNTFHVEIVNPYQYGTKKAKSNEKQDKVFSPMPGKVIRILVKEGEIVRAGSPVIIIEAMKMQSEYKVKDDCLVKKILVNEGDNIAGNQSLIELGEAPEEENIN
ncbi:MAG: acetyl-CoA carboxylase biotin carboxyl carrier protein subunit [Paludibacteraceae bacterium]|nr:acetyl-CoA carboxylase biotin carboxyl carrier protein subunit [Paludibacteraceae bacterium]MBO7636676.1 acetyl-CoA carboxylase biotin carboxyl carrier protein subunit [Paludibacteraceae bacterium]MBR5972777.1 acetyl-CoA carboxylase biotin carboxyl carrier protein subunit [Paludibacteraceae bacterium]